MHVAELWRYPVKSLRGERLDAVRLDSGGFPGDRALVVRDERGDLVTARTRGQLLGLEATLNGGGEALVDGRPWDDPATAAAVRSAAGDGARLVRAGDGHAHDESPLLVATDGAIDALGYEGRRFRANIVIAGAPGMAERGWEGRRLRAGEAEIDLRHLCERCVLTTIHPDTLEVDPEVLRRINAELDRRFMLNAWVLKPGRIAVGDPVELL
jgi:uncharacterized protein YcbX